MSTLAACGTVSADVGYLVPVSGDEGYDTSMVEGRVTSAGLVKLGVAARSKLGDGPDQLYLGAQVGVGFDL